MVYLILGAAGSGRREVVADLIEGGLGEGDRPLVLLSSAEGPNPVDDRLAEAVRLVGAGARAGEAPRSGEEGALGAVARWQWVPAPEGAWSGAGVDEGVEPEPAGTIEAEIPAGTTHVFLVTDGRSDPVDQIEAFKAWVNGGLAWGRGGSAGAFELARVVCVVNCALAARHPPLVAWYDACIHFSDIVLLGRREGVPNKWMGDFQGRYKDRFYPCLFEFVKGGRVANPPAVLVPEARRLSHFFEEDADWVVTGEDGAEADAEDDPESMGEGEEEIEARMAIDPYLERRQGGRRVRELPKVAKFLDEDAQSQPPGGG